MRISQWQAWAYMKITNLIWSDYGSWNSKDNLKWAHCKGKHKPTNGFLFCRLL